MNKSVTEWQILFSMTSGLEDFYTEDEDEYNEKFQDLIDNGDLQYVEQCVRKDYVWNEELEDWDEDWVEVLYDAENYDDYKDTQRGSVRNEYKYKVSSYYDMKYMGVEDTFYTNDWTDVEDEAHKKLMQGNYVLIQNLITGKEVQVSPDEYDETFDGEFLVKPEQLEESKDTTNGEVKKLAKYIVSHYKEITGLEPNEFNKIAQDFRDGKLNMTHKDLGGIATKELDDIKEFVKKYDIEHNTKLYTDNCMNIFEEIDNEINRLSKKEEKLPNVSNIQGLEYYSVDEIKRIAEDYIREALINVDENPDDLEIVDMNIYGSRNRGTAREDSDLDIVFEYKGDFREDDLFNLLNDDEEPLMFDDVVVDFNPICAERSGDMASFMARAKEYDDEILNKKKTETTQLNEDQYENERRKGKPNVTNIAETEYEDNIEWYKEHIKDFVDEKDFIAKNIIDIAAEYNLKADKAQDVCAIIYKLATSKKVESKYADDYRGNEYWELNDLYNEEGSITAEDVLEELKKLYASKEAIKKAYEEITGEELNDLDEKYNVYTISGEDGVYNTNKVDTVDTVEQAQDRVAELQAETGNNAFYEEADDWWEANYKRAINYVANETPEVVVGLFGYGDKDDNAAWDMYMSSTSKSIALELLHYLGQEEFEKILDEYEKGLEESYVSYEEPYNGKKMSKAQWKEIYDKEINHDPNNCGWETFEDWWKDMTEKDKLIVKESVGDNFSNMVMELHSYVEGNPKTISQELKQAISNNTLDDYLKSKAAMTDDEIKSFKTKYGILTSKKTESKETDRQLRINYKKAMERELEKVQRSIENAGSGDISNLEDRRDFLMNKLDQLDSDLEKKEESKTDRVEVELYHLEDMGGHTMAVFGKLKDGRYFAGNESYLGIYDEDIWPQFCEDDPDTTEWEKQHTLKVVYPEYGTATKEDEQLYYDIISQTSFFDEDDLEWFKEKLGLDESKKTEATVMELQEQIEKEIDDGIYTYLLTKGGETEESAKEYMKDYIVVETWQDKMTSINSAEITENYIVVEVRAELNYEDITELADDLNYIVRKYDKTAYFDNITSGIIRAYIQIDDKKLTEAKVTDAERVKKALNYMENEYNELGTDDYEFLHDALTKGKTAKDKIKAALNYMENEYNELGSDDYYFLHNILTLKEESKKVVNEATSSTNKANALLDLFNELYDGMGDMYAIDEWAEILASDYNIDAENMEAEKVILTALSQMDDKAFKQEVDNFILGLVENDGVEYLKDTLHIYPRNLKHIIQCLNTIKPYASEPDKIDEAIEELQSANLDLRLTAEEFQRYLHDNYKPWEVLGTTTGPRTYVNLFEVPTDYDIVGADYFNYANRPADMLEHIGYGWKQEGDNIVADLIGFTHSVKGSAARYDQAPVYYDYSATIDSSNKEEKFKEMANALMSKAKEIKKQYKLGESKTTKTEAIRYVIYKNDEPASPYGNPEDSYTQYNDMNEAIIDAEEIDADYIEKLIYKNEDEADREELADTVSVVWKNKKTKTRESKKVEAKVNADALKISVAKKLADDMIKAMGNDVTGMDKETYYKNTLVKLNDPKYIDSEIKNYECDNSNRSTTMVKDLNDLKKALTEDVNIEDVNIEKEKEKVADDIQRAGAKDMVDTEQELVDGIKKEVYQFAKQQGLDLEKLRKQGVELEAIADTIDKVIGDMVSKTAIEFMDQTNQEINWDFDIEGNDIKIIITK